METQERVAQVFPANKDISVKKSLSVKGLVSVIIAVAAFALSSVVTDPQSSLKLALLVAGVAMIVYGVIKLALGKKTVIYKATGDVLSQTDILFDSQEVVRLKRMVEDRQFDNIATLKLITGNKAGVKLSMGVTADRKFACIQVFEFIPFSYEPVMPQISLYGDEAAKLAEAVDKVKSKAL
ncbi:hypothetical protein OCV73_04980 [Barnesiella propionica]|uniref:hypothetical protein n=1 Tax=Barnesiella propionica TaxID=2981781 RepID=UPI0011CBB213|nr:hypothetical protein [Barnesiella propionica]MCU6768300.1 hypothetical protein [Barnesiella propionica]